MSENLRNRDMYGVNEDSALFSYSRCYCGELKEEAQPCRCCETSIIVTDSDQLFVVEEERKEVQHNLQTVPEECTVFEWRTPDNRKISIKRDRIVAVLGWGEYEIDE